jgi:hypothetical protein
LWSFLADIWKTMERDPEARERLMPYWRPTKMLVRNHWCRQRSGGD